MSDDQDQDIQPYAYPHPYMAQYSIIERQKQNRRHRAMAKRFREHTKWQEQKLKNRRVVLYCPTTMPVTHPSLLSAIQFCRENGWEAPRVVRHDIEDSLSSADHLIVVHPNELSPSFGSFVSFLFDTRRHDLTLHILGEQGRLRRLLVWALA